jgi:hypothetical protein
VAHDGGEGRAARPDTPDVPLLELRAAAAARMDMQGVPYLRLGPCVVLAVSLLGPPPAPGGGGFGLQQVSPRPVRGQGALARPLGEPRRGLSSAGAKPGSLHHRAALEAVGPHRPRLAPC